MYQQIENSYKIICFQLTPRDPVWKLLHSYIDEKSNKLVLLCEMDYQGTETPHTINCVRVDLDFKTGIPGSLDGFAVDVFRFENEFSIDTIYDISVKAIPYSTTILLSSMIEEDFEDLSIVKFYSDGRLPICKKDAIKIPFNDCCYFGFKDTITVISN